MWIGKSIVLPLRERCYQSNNHYITFATIATLVVAQIKLLPLKMTFQYMIRFRWSPLPLFFFSVESIDIECTECTEINSMGPCIEASSIMTYHTASVLLADAIATLLPFRSGYLMWDSFGWVSITSFRVNFHANIMQNDYYGRSTSRPQRSAQRTEFFFAPYDVCEHFSSI